MYRDPKSTLTLEWRKHMDMMIDKVIEERLSTFEMSKRFDDLIDNRLEKVLEKIIARKLEFTTKIAINKKNSFDCTVGTKTIRSTRRWML